MRDWTEKLILTQKVKPYGFFELRYKFILKFFWWRNSVNGRGCLCAQFRNLNHVASFYFVCYKPLVESRINLFTHMHSYCKESDSFKISNWGLHPGVITNLLCWGRLYCHSPASFSRIQVEMYGSWFKFISRPDLLSYLHN